MSVSVYGYGFLSWRKLKLNMYDIASIFAKLVNRRKDHNDCNRIDFQLINFIYVETEQKQSRLNLNTTFST